MMMMMMMMMMMVMMMMTTMTITLVVLLSEAVTTHSRTVVALSTLFEVLRRSHALTTIIGVSCHVLYPVPQSTIFYYSLATALFIMHRGYC